MANLDEFAKMNSRHARIVFAKCSYEIDVVLMPSEFLCHVLVRVLHLEMTKGPRKEVAFGLDSEQLTPVPARTLERDTLLVRWARIISSLPPALSPR